LRFRRTLAPIRPLVSQMQMHPRFHQQDLWLVGAGKAVGASSQA